MNYYLVEFVDDSVHSQYEEVSAISAQEAVNSIKLGLARSQNLGMFGKKLVRMTNGKMNNGYISIQRSYRME